MRLKRLLQSAATSVDVVSPGVVRFLPAPDRDGPRAIRAALDVLRVEGEWTREADGAYIVRLAPK